MYTYLNKNGNPIIRRCENCIHFNKIITKQTGPGSNIGYCSLRLALFAPTMEQTVCFISKSYYLCDLHTLVNEDHLKMTATQVDMKTILKKR